MIGIDQAISLIIVVLVFCVIAYGLNWVCVHYAMPQPVLWICGVILLIIILMFAARQFGGGGAMPHGIIK